MGSMKMPATILILLSLLLVAEAASAQPGQAETGERKLSRLTQNESAREDSVLLDVTWLHCSDTLESLLMMRDGRTIYSVGGRGVAFRLGESMKTQVELLVGGMESQTDTAGLDSCSTIGVILSGPRYLLLNRRAPTDQTRDFLYELATLRKYCARRLERDIERSLRHIEKRADVEGALASDPKLDPYTLEYSLYLSPIVRAWRCRGTVRVTAQIDSRGRVRNAFVRDPNLIDKCAALMVTTALRGVLLAAFAPAEDEEGKAGSAWVNVVVETGGS